VSRSSGTENNAKAFSRYLPDDGIPGKRGGKARKVAWFKRLKQANICFDLWR
jgi:hypothetical protein